MRVFPPSIGHAQISSETGPKPAHNRQIEAEAEQYRGRMRADYIGRVTIAAQCEQSTWLASESGHNATLSVQDSQRWVGIWTERKSDRACFGAFARSVERSAQMRACPPQNLTSHPTDLRLSTFSILKRVDCSEANLRWLPHEVRLALSVS